MATAIKTFSNASVSNAANQTITNLVGLPTIPSNAAIDSVILSFTCYRKNGPADNEIRVQLGDTIHFYIQDLAHKTNDNRSLDIKSIVKNNNGVLTYINGGTTLNLSAWHNWTLINATWELSNIKITVNYQTPYTVSLTPGTGCASVSGGGSYFQGHSATISCTSLPGYDIGASGIVKWQDSAGNIVFEYTPHTFNVYQNYSLTCNLYPNTYFISYNANGGGGNSNRYDETLNYDEEYTIRGNEWFTGQEVTIKLTEDGSIINTLVKNKDFTGWLRRDTSEIYSVGEKVKNLTTEHAKTIQLDAQWAQPVFILPAPAPKEGYEFLGWRYNSSTVYQPGDSFQFEKDTTVSVSLTAEWKKLKIEDVYGGNNKAGIYVANTECKAVYVGNTKVYG